MAFKYEEVVPWGRSFNEYRCMLHLTHEDLQQSILGCADGPANFNAEMYRRGHRVISYADAREGARGSCQSYQVHEPLPG
jgi:hypothetical protein